MNNRFKSNARELEMLLRTNCMEKAWLRLNEMNESGSANVIHFTIMMKACSSSAEMITLMDRMKRLRHPPNTFSYNTLVTQLMLEGRMDDAIDVVEIEMVEACVKPDEKTMKTIWNHSDEWSMMRTGKRWVLTINDSFIYRGIISPVFTFFIDVFFPLFFSFFLLLLFVCVCFFFLFYFPFSLFNTCAPPPQQVN